MKKLIALAGVAAVSMGVATAPVQAQSAGHILRGAGIGAAGGAIVGAVVPGVGIGTGALVGGAGGALFNTLHHGKRHYYRGRGYRYHGRYHHYR